MVLNRVCNSFPFISSSSIPTFIPVYSHQLLHIISQRRSFQFFELNSLLGIYIPPNSSLLIWILSCEFICVSGYGCTSKRWDLNSSPSLMLMGIYNKHLMCFPCHLPWLWPLPLPFPPYILIFPSQQQISCRSAEHRRLSRVSVAAGMDQFLQEEGSWAIVLVFMPPKCQNKIPNTLFYIVFTLYFYWLINSN